MTIEPANVDMSVMAGKSVEILLVEDSDSDARLAQAALNRLEIPNHVHHVEDGEEAVAFLRREMPFAQAPRPSLILLDLNLPRKSGLEVLAEIKADQSLRDIPVVVMSTSKAEEDVTRSYELKANCFVTKSLDYGTFSETVRALGRFWFGVGQLSAGSS